jgi:hypothetical protein
MIADRIVALRDQLAPPRPCTQLQLKPGDTVVHAPGFEDRTMAITSVLSTSTGGRGILLDYRPQNPKNRLDDVRRALAAKGISISDQDIVVYHRFDPADFEARLLERLRVCQTKSAIVDISTMSKLGIMLVLDVCNRLGIHTEVFYTEARSYSPTQEEFEEAREKNEIHRPSLHVFTGVYGVVRVDSLASVAMQGQPTAAIVFMSFNDALTQSLLNTVYPGRLFLINGRPPLHTWRELATAWVHDQVRREWEEDNPVGAEKVDGLHLPARVVSTLDYRDSVTLLIQLYWELSAGHRVLLAPSGSKLQAVACYLLKGLHPDIHIEYPSPEGFSPEYSSGVGASWLIDLGIISESLSALSCMERRAFLEIDIEERP